MRSRANEVSLFQAASMSIWFVSSETAGRVTVGCGSMSDSVEPDGADGAVVTVAPATVLGVAATVPSSVPPEEHDERTKTSMMNAAPTAPGAHEGYRERRQPSVAVWLTIGPSAGANSKPDVAVAGFDQPALIGERHRLGAVGEPELGEDGRDM